MATPSWFSTQLFRLSDSYTHWRETLSNGPSWVRSVVIVSSLVLLVLIVLSVYWSFEPKQFDVNHTAIASAEANDGQMVTGSATTATLIRVSSTLLDKPGGYLTNDILPPGLWLDNIPNWEFGVLVQVRDMSKAMRESFSRSQSQSTEDDDLALAEPRFNFDNDNWILPSTESFYEEGIGKLNNYHERLLDQSESNAQFYARADNLRYWLNTVETRLGSLSQRLSASVGQRRVNTDLAGEENASQSTPAKNELKVQTPWLEIDDVFYEARGTTWALIHFLKAVEIDFQDILQKKNALVSLRQIIRELEATQETVYSPMILNGGGFGMMANHSLVMASYISRAHAGIIDLRDLLSQG